MKVESSGLRDVCGMFLGWQKNGRVGASQLGLVVKNPLASEGDARDQGLIPG